MQLGEFSILDEAISLNELKLKDVAIEFILVNFETKSAIKIIPFFNTIKSVELVSLVNFFVELGVNIRLDDLLGKLHIVILKLLLQDNKEQIIMVNDVGLTTSSVDFLLSNFNLMKDKIKNKSVLFCPKLIY